MAYSSGLVHAVGSAVWHGDMTGGHLNRQIVGVASTPDGGGYWLVGADGGIFSFGDAQFYGSTGSRHLNKPVIGMASTADGRGYWLFAGDGGIFSFGDAAFCGSTGSQHLNQPIVGMSATSDGRGYWLVAADGGIFSFGDARFLGSTGSLRLRQPVAGMASSADGGGYWLVAADGGVFSFGDAPFRGAATSMLDGAGAVSLVRATNNGYWIVSSVGTILPFDAPALPSVPNPTPPPPSTPVAAAPPSPAPAAPAPASLPATANPTVSIPPSSLFAQDCFTGTDNAACDATALAAINQARAGEGLGPLSLPTNFEQLNFNGQSLAVANAERTSRGLPAFPENPVIDALAQTGALLGVDPTGPASYGWGSNIAWGYRTPLAADFAWMYDDGPGSPNIACTPSDSSGCWGHRDNILSPWPGAAGAGVYVNNGVVQLTQLFVENY